MAAPAGGRLTGIAGASPDLIRLRRARDRMDCEYAQPLDVPALARTTLMSPGHFPRSFRAAFGETPYSYPMTRRIERAKALPRRRDLTVMKVLFTTDDCDATIGSCSASGAEALQEPMDQPYGVRDCAIRDPAGNMLRFNQQR